MATSDFFNFDFLTSKISKNYFFEKKYFVLAIKSKILRIFKKLEYMWKS